MFQAYLYESTVRIQLDKYSGFLTTWMDDLWNRAGLRAVNYTCAEGFIRNVAPSK